MFLLDTNTCIYYLNGTYPELARRLLSSGPKPLALSALTVAELQFGAQRSSRPEANQQRLTVFLGEIAVVEFGELCANHFGRIKADLLGRGRPIPDFDIGIAATAVATGRTLVSSDAHMQEVVGMRLEDWTA